MMRARRSNLGADQQQSGLGRRVEQVTGYNQLDNQGTNMAEQETETRRPMGRYNGCHRNQVARVWLSFVPVFSVQKIRQTMSQNCMSKLQSVVGFHVATICFRGRPALTAEQP